MTRGTALEALKKYNKEPFHIPHALTVEDVMRWFVQDQGYGEEKDFQGIADLLRSIDFEMYPEQRCVKAPELLREAGTEGKLIYAMCNHGYSLVTDMKPEHQIERILFTSDELMGPIGAAARMRLSRSVMDMGVSSLKKKLKDKRFAAGCSRDVIREGAEGLGWALEEFADKTIWAMRSYEAVVGEEMKAYEAWHLPHYHLHLLQDYEPMYGHSLRESPPQKSEYLLYTNLFL